MENKDLELQVSKVVEDLLKEKEEAKLRINIEAELQKSASTISELTSALDEKNTEVAEFESKISEESDRIQELESELEAAKKEAENANEKLGEVTKTLEDMKKDRAAELRLVELEDAGVARSDRDSQKDKIFDMTDEDFASYKDELVSIRKAIVAELNKANEKADADAKAEEEAKAKAEAAEERKKKDDEEAKNKDKGSGGEESAEEDTGEENASDEEDNKTTPPAQITPGQAVMASLNMEYIPSESIAAKYKEMGKAMAAKFKKSE